MAREPKLEIFKIKLINKEDGRPAFFSDFYRKKFNGYKSLTPPYTTEDIFKVFHSDFLKQIDDKAYKTSKSKDKAFTIAYDEDERKTRTTLISSPFSSEMKLNGILEGGKHGTPRWLGDISDTTRRSNIKTNNVVNDRYYFLIYTPLNHSQGVVMIQGYTESKISDVFREHLLSYYKYQKEIQSKFEIYVPNAFKNEYLEKAIFKKLQFTSGWHIDSFSEPTEKEYDLEIKIEIIDKSRSKSNYKRVSDILSKFGQSVFKPTGGKQKELVNFDKINAKMESNGKELPLHIDNEENITPVILLRNQGIKVENGVPDFKQIDTYCRNLLTDIENEIRPSNAINPL
jgi:hypothetical protein